MLGLTTFSFPPTHPHHPPTIICAICDVTVAVKKVGQIQYPQVLVSYLAEIVIEY